MKSKQKQHYKYIHILWHFEKKFTIRIVNLFNDDTTGIDNSEHHFVTPFEEVYNEICQFPNVEYVSTKNPMSAGLINRYAPQCDWLILHNICTGTELMKVRKKYLGKILWRTWGGGRLSFFTCKTGRPIRNLIKVQYNRLLYDKVRRFACIGVANVVDEIEIEKKFGKMPFYNMAYPLKSGSISYNYDIRDYDECTRNSNLPIRVMIGHSAHEVNNHIEMLNRLKKYYDEKIIVVLVLNYGNREYAKKVSETAIDIFGEKVEIITDFLDYYQYKKIIHTVDIAIFDGKVSYALGNIELLVSEKKKIFLNSKGVLREAFERLNIPYSTTDDISKMTFDEFTSRVHYEGEGWKELTERDYNYYVALWKRIINDFR